MHVTSKTEIHCFCSLNSSQLMPEGSIIQERQFIVIKSDRASYVSREVQDHLSVDKTVCYSIQLAVPTTYMCIFLFFSSPRLQALCTNHTSCNQTLAKIIFAQ